MAYEIGDIVSYKLGDIGHVLKGLGLIINNLDSSYAVFDEGHKTIVRKLRDINITLLIPSDIENKRQAERILNAYSKILKSETSPIVLL